MVKYDVETVLQTADFPTVASAIGLNAGKKKGDRYPFLCPAHNDTKMGNCGYSTKRKMWHCFACHAGGNLGDLAAYVMYGDSSPQNFYKAIGFIAEMYGISGEESKKGSGIPFLTTEEQEFLGVYNGSIVETVNILTKDGEDDPEEPVREQASRSMLYSLYRDEPDEFKSLLARKCEEKRKRILGERDIIREAVESARKRGDLKGLMGLDALGLNEKTINKELRKLNEIKKKYKLKESLPVD